MAKIYPFDAARHRHRKRNRPTRRRLSVSTVTLGLLPFALFSALWAFAPQGKNEPLAAFAATNDDKVAASFGLCHAGGGINCVVDGDTLYFRSIKIRIADIDTPETHEPRCAEEAVRGAAATKRLLALVNAGPFALENINRDEDSYGRKLRILTRAGQSLGEVLVNEGLARRYEGGRRSWC